MTRPTGGEWGRVYAAAAILVAGEQPTPVDLVEVLVEGQRGYPYGEAVETVERALDDTEAPLTETDSGVECHAMPRATEEGRGYPEEIIDREYWVTWALDSVGRKRPRAPWKDGHAYPTEWRNSLEDEKDPKTSFDEAKRYADLDPATVKRGYGAPDDDPEPGNLKLGILLPKDRPAVEERVTLVDWDDVRDPETGELHPVAAAYIEYYPGYAEISQSGKGIHQFVLGGLSPHNRKKFIEAIDEEPFVGGDIPQIELYDGGRHTAMTGRRVNATRADVETDQKLIDDAIRRFGGGERTTITDDGAVPDHKKGEFSGVDLADRPDGRPKCYHAVLKAREHSDELDHIANWELIGYAAMLGAAHGLERERILENLHPEHGGHGTPQYGFDQNREPDEVRRVFTQVQDGDLFPPSANTLTERGLLPGAGSCDCSLHADEKPAAEPESALPIAQLRALNPQERRRAAKKRGLHIPETEEVQDRVADAIDTAVAEERTTVVEAPTGAGKSYYSSTSAWKAKAEADDAPTLVLTGTKEHRKQNAEKSRQADVTNRQLRGRTEACEVAAGEHDPEAVAEAEEDLQVVTVGGVPASQWFDAQCEGKGLPFSVAHKYAESHNDQGVSLPCHEEGEECLAIAQWDGIPRNDDGDAAADVIHATHQFAMVPSLRMHTNLLFDELPDFTIDVGEHGLSHDRIHRMVAAYLDEVDARVATWEAFVSMANAPGNTDAGAEAEQLERTIQNERPGVEWYFDEQDAHTLAPALTRAIWFALKDEADANGRRMATVSHEPPRLDKNANDADGWNREWVRVVLDEQNRVVKLWDTPDLSQARSVVGLDARPAMPRWQLNVAPGIDRTKVLDTEERALWRHFEQGKTVVQVGDATRPFTSGEYFDRQGTTALLEHLTDEHGDVPVITAGSVEHEHREILEELGVDEPKTMHYGEEKSREDFADEDALLVNGVIDPGDDLVLDLLAALDKNATPETTENDDGEEVRDHGRGFDGEDADTAEAILESVRANHVAQAVGRSGRNPDSEERSVVYVRTDVAPPDLVDYQVPGVQWLYGEKQRAILAHVRENPGVTAREVAENTDATKEHVRNTLEKLEQYDMLSVREGAGAYGADLHRLDGDAAENGVADITIANSPVWEHYTLRLAIDAVHLDGTDTTPAPEAAEAGPNAQLVQFGADPPS